MASISPIRLVFDLTDQVYQRLLNAICDGHLAPNGSRAGTATKPDIIWCRNSAGMCAKQPESAFT